MWRPYIPAWSISSCMFKLQSKSSVIIIYAMYCHMIKEACGSESDTFWVGVRYLVVFGKSLISSKTPVDLDRSSQHKKNETVGIVRYAGRSRELLYRYHYWLMYEDTMFGKCEISSLITILENKENQLCSKLKHHKEQNIVLKCHMLLYFFSLLINCIDPIFTTYYNYNKQLVTWTASFVWVSVHQVFFYLFLTLFYKPK